MGWLAAAACAPGSVLVHLSAAPSLAPALLTALTAAAFTVDVTFVAHFVDQAAASPATLLDAGTSEVSVQLAWPLTPAVSATCVDVAAAAHVDTQTWPAPPPGFTRRLSTCGIRSAQLVAPDRTTAFTVASSTTHFYAQPSIVDTSAGGDVACAASPAAFSTLPCARATIVAGPATVLTQRCLGSSSAVTVGGACQQVFRGDAPVAVQLWLDSATLSNGGGAPAAAVGFRATAKGLVGLRVAPLTPCFPAAGCHPASPASSSSASSEPGTGLSLRSPFTLLWVVGLILGVMLCGVAAATVWRVMAATPRRPRGDSAGHVGRMARFTAGPPLSAQPLRRL